MLSGVVYLAESTTEYYPLLYMDTSSLVSSSFGGAVFLGKSSSVNKTGGGVGIVLSASFTSITFSAGLVSEFLGSFIAVFIFERSISIK